VVKKIIVVDDSPTFLMYAGLLLKRLNFKVIPAENGVEFFRLLKFGKPDAVLLDIEMPMMDGMKVLKHVKEDKQTSKIPVIVVSVDSSPETIEKCRGLGCHDYLTKPVKIDRLHGVLQECFFGHTGTSRRHLRERFIRKIPVSHDGKRYEFYSETLSEGGLYLRTRDPFAVGTEIGLTLALEGATMTVKGDVIYTKDLHGDYLDLPPGMAIKFKELTGEDLRLLKEYVSDLLAKDIFESQEERIIER
jgi:uncharacterized protein (TIGR02266 family)